jgi:hypothetical protein
MQGILKNDHQRFCNSLKVIKITPATEGQKLIELENELQSLYNNYQEKMMEIKQIIQVYEEKKKSIRNEIKKIQKYAIPDNRNVTDLVLVKVVALFILFTLNDFIGIVNETDLSCFI